MILPKPGNKVEVYKTIAVLSLALLLSYFYWKNANILYGLGVLISIVLFVFPVAVWIHRIWMGLANILAWINTRILLSVIFYLILTPLALLQRMFSKSAINHPPGDELETYFETPDNQHFDAENFKQSW